MACAYEIDYCRSWNGSIVLFDIFREHSIRVSPSTSRGPSCLRPPGRTGTAVVATGLNNDFGQRMAKDGEGISSGVTYSAPVEARCERTAVELLA